MQNLSFPKLLFIFEIMMRVCFHVLHLKVLDVLYDRPRVLYCESKGNGISFKTF